MLGPPQAEHLARARRKQAEPPERLAQSAQLPIRDPAVPPPGQTSALNKLLAIGQGNEVESVLLRRLPKEDWVLDLKSHPEITFEDLAAQVTKGVALGYVRLPLLRHPVPLLADRARENFSARGARYDDRYLAPCIVERDKSSLGARAHSHADRSLLVSNGEDRTRVVET